METVENVVVTFDSFLWKSLIPGLPIPGFLVILLVPTGLWLTFCLRGIQFRKLGAALHLALF
jgi:AGCS family alanine or glycine:cation symporter